MDEQKHDSQIKFETLIAALSTDFISGDNKSTEETIYLWMKEIAVTLNAEISVLFLRHPKGDLFISDFWRKDNSKNPVFFPT